MNRVPAAGSPAATNSARPDARKILVVDDDPVFTRVVARILSSFGANVVTSNRGFGLLNTIATERPALIVLDVMMPGLDGAAITSLIRSDPELRGTPVLLCSGMESTALAKKAAESDANGFVSKTVSPAQLQSELRSWLSRIGF